MAEFDRSAFIGKFQEEAGEYLQRLNEGVITLEQEPENRELIDQMLRDAHTLKGSSRMVGLIEISDVAHRLEDLMVKIRDGEMRYEPRMSDVFFEALDAIVFLSEHAGKETTGDLDVAALLGRLADVIGEGPTADESPGNEGGAEPGAAEETPDRGDGLAGAPSDAEDVSAPGEASQTEDTDVAARQASTKLGTKTQPTVRVRTEQVDTLLNLVSEVVIGQIKADQKAHELRALASDLGEIWQAWIRVKSALSALGMEDSSIAEVVMDDVDVLDGLLAERRRTLGHFVKDYADDVSRSSAVVADLQDHGMRLRMLPVSTVLNSFPRAMRDLAHDYRKDVELSIEGGDTELDKKVLEEINDPLIHILRNAVDHGIEAQDVRRAAGKPPKGSIKISARQEGDRIVIEISDDGAGIDPDKVRQAAVRKGYLTEAETHAMSDREATYLIFEAGFSTSAIITEISGRGVGMDVVREFIVEKLKGSLDVTSELGVGTTFRLTIPLTLAIIRALMLKCGGRAFAMPTASIEETLRMDSADVLRVEGREVIRRQRRTIPLVRLADILGLPTPETAGVKIPVAVIGFSGHRMGFVVDSFLGEQQIVIKPLGSHLRKVENVAGVTVLGAGEVVPILNVPDLMQAARMRSVASRAVDVETDTVGKTRRILICEDSFTTRELERSIFEAAGYEVEVAMDGAMGLAKLREGLQIDAVVTDVQMPNMTGFELTKAIKSDPLLEVIPVVIVTSLEREEEKAEGIEAGADAYITKSVFNQDTLLDTVERLIR